MLIKFIKFPDGQLHFSEYRGIFPGHTVKTRIRNFEDIGKLYLLNDVLKREHSIGIRDLVIYWMAGARWDRPIGKRESFDLKVFSDLINALEIPHVSILDPHSYAALGAVDNANAYEFEQGFYYKFIENKDKLLVIPDAGAKKRGELFLIWQRATEHIQCLKTRTKKDALSISCFAPNYDIHSLVRGKKLIIVDDICDGGATFIEIARQLEQYMPESLDLMVTHGIFSKGFDELNKYFANIYTTNSFQEMDDIWKERTTDGNLHTYKIFTPNEASYEYFIVD